jgi:hypothetical protein
MRRPLSVASMLVLLVARASGAAPPDDDAARKVNYKDDVAPIFNARCNGCHNNDKKKGGLVLDGYASMMQGGGSGAVVEPGDPDNSRLYLLVAHQEEPAMPPNSPKIPDAELDTIRRWIEAGAPEASGSVVAVKAKPRLEFALDPSAIGKPSGEPAMPRGLSTEPVVVSARPNAITALAHSPWAPLAAVAGHKQVLLYNTQEQVLVGVLPFPEGIVEVLKFTTDGDLLLAGGGRGGQSGRVVVWDVKTGERLFEIGKEYDTVLAADISPDRRLVALGGPSKVLRVYQTSDGELAYECTKHTEWVTAVAFSPDGVLLASGDRNGGLVVWEAVNGREFHDLRNHTAMITDVSFRLDSNVLASCSEDGTIRLWEMENGGEIKNWGAHSGGVASVRFARDGRLVSAGRDLVVKLWDPNGAAQRQFDAFADVALKAAFTHDETAIVAGDFTGEVRLYAVDDGRPLGHLSANPAPVAVRLEQTNDRYAQAVAEADTAASELASLQSQAAARDDAVAQAGQALDQAARHDADVRAALSSAEHALAQKAEAERDAGLRLGALDDAAARARRLRVEAFRELAARHEAARVASVAFAATGAQRERGLVEQAEAALERSQDDLASKLPEWNEAIEAAADARLAYERAASARLAAEAPLPGLRHAASRAQAAIPLRQEALAAAQQARQAAEQAIAEKQPLVAAAHARAKALRAQLESLAAEQRRRDVRAAASQSAHGTPVPGS